MTVWQIGTLLYNAAPVWPYDRTTMSDKLKKMSKKLNT